jgi:hypothetical protein
MAKSEKNRYASLVHVFRLWVGWVVGKLVNLLVLHAKAVNRPKFGLDTPFTLTLVL